MTTLTKHSTKTTKHAPTKRPNEGSRREPADDAALRRRAIERWENEGGLAPPERGTDRASPSKRP